MILDIQSLQILSSLQQHFIQLMDKNKKIKKTSRISRIALLGKNLAIRTQNPKASLKLSKLHTSPIVPKKLSVIKQEPLPDIKFRNSEIEQANMKISQVQQLIHQQLQKRCQLQLQQKKFRKHIEPIQMKIAMINCWLLDVVSYFKKRINLIEEIESGEQSDQDPDYDPAEDEKSVQEFKEGDEVEQVKESEQTKIQRRQMEIMKQVLKNKLKVNEKRAEKIQKCIDVIDEQFKANEEVVDTYMGWLKTLKQSLRKMQFKIYCEQAPETE